MTASEKPYVPIADRPLLGVPEAAALCGLSEKAVYTAIKRGELLVCYVHSSTAHIRRRDLDGWISVCPNGRNKRKTRPLYGSFEPYKGRVYQVTI